MVFDKVLNLPVEYLRIGYERDRPLDVITPSPFLACHIPQPAVDVRVPERRIDVEVIRELVVDANFQAEPAGQVFLQNAKVDDVRPEHPPDQVVTPVTDGQVQPARTGAGVFDSEVSMGITSQVFTLLDID